MSSSTILSGQHMWKSGYTLKLQRFLAVAAMTCGLSACGGSEDFSPVSISFATLSKGSNSRVNLSVEFLGHVARTETEWRALWSQHNAGLAFLPPPPCC